MSSDTAGFGAIPGGWAADATLCPMDDGLKCPHCGDGIHAQWRQSTAGWDGPHQVDAFLAQCPLCKRLIFAIERLHPNTGDVRRVATTAIIWPRRPPPRPVPEEVDQKLAELFTEACLVLSDSARASAALSRRCLQQLLREHAGVSDGRLVAEIDEAIESGDLPSALTTDLHAVRQVGNFAGHPLKDTTTAQILDVEPGEAEWLLDLLEGLFDHYFVKPARADERRAAVNAKLEAAGKPLIEDPEVTAEAGDGE